MCLFLFRHLISQGPLKVWVSPHHHLICPSRKCLISRRRTVIFRLLRKINLIKPKIGRAACGTILIRIKWPWKNKQVKSKLQPVTSGRNSTEGAQSKHLSGRANSLTSKSSIPIVKWPSTKTMAKTQL